MVYKTCGKYRHYKYYDYVCTGDQGASNGTKISGTQNYQQKTW